MSKQRLQLTWYNKDMALIPTEVGKYGYSWVHPSDPRYCETHFLIFDEYVSGTQQDKTDGVLYSERADYEPQSDNLLIRGESGDVLESLTRVPELASKYVNKVRLIYIDPPFNTAQSFESYEDNLEHSIWLTMMRDRLLHMKRLLSDDGTIWIHLNETEVHRMRLLLDEVLGSTNFIAEMVWQRKTSSQNDNGGISLDTDFILVFAKHKELVSFNGLERTAASESAYSNPDNDPRGPWRESDYKMKSGSIYPIIHPLTGEEVFPPEGTCWRYSQKTHEKNLADNRLYWGKTQEYRYPKFKRFRSEVADTRIPNNLLLADEVDTTRRVKQHLKGIFGSEEFSTPKPEKLLERIIHMATNPGDVVFDCFAGSGTTAAVAQKMGRRWVTCELLESTFETFTKPRLTMVVNDLDQEGISFTEGERIPADDVDLPDGVSANDAAKFVSVLNKILAEHPEMKKESLVKELKALTKTKKAKGVANWRGGGGFQVAHLSPECFDYDEELNRVVLTDSAHGERLIRSVAANLGFAMLEKEQSYVFDAKRGNAFLKVVESAVTIELVDWLSSHLSQGDSMVIAAVCILDGVREHLRKTARGSRIISIPDDMFRIPQRGDE